MSRVDIINDIKNKINEKYKQFKCDSKAKANFSEEQTKTSLILPLLSCLGYDISDDNQLVAEDKDKSGAPGIKSSESIDYTLRVDGNDIAIIECKKLGKVLNSNDVQQLFRYYSTKQVHIAILTNGDDYLFFTDGHRENIMDCVPYKSLHISSLSDFSEFNEFSKDNIKSAFIPHVRAVNKDKYNELELEYKNSSLKLKQVTKELDKLRGKEYLTSEQKNKLESLEIYIEENKKLREKVELFKSYFSIKVTKDTKVGYGSDFDRFKVPSDIAKSMVDMIPDDSITLDSKFIDICCRHGEFVIALRNKLFKCPNLIQAIYDDEERLDYIRQNMIYAIMPDKKGLEKVTKALYGTTNVKVNNIVAYNNVDEYKYLIKVYKIYKQTGMKSVYIGDVEKALLEKLGDILFMKFDYVVSNPPYNSDQYIDFVNLGDSLSKQCSVYITPAKWQSKGGKKNEQFRQDIVPRMKEIVYSPDCEDAFNITTWGGVSYFLVDKEKRDKVHVKTHCGNELFEDDGYVNIDDRSKISLLTKASHIINKVLNENFKKFSAGCQRDLNDYIVIVQNTFSGSGKTLYKSGAFLLSPLTYEKDNGRELKDNEAIIAGYKTEEQCQSCISYMNTRLIRFLMLLSVHGQHIFSSIDMTTWRFVPSPDSFDHIFTDDELYKKYNITQDEINIIESVIKERKSK